MKNLKGFALVVIFVVLFLFIISSDVFAKIKEFIPVKSGTEEALDMFARAENEFIRGQMFQKKEDYGNAIVCYVRSLESWRNDEARLNLAYCFYTVKYYLTAEKIAISGLETAKQKTDSKNYFSFLFLLGVIYDESDCHRKALAVYEHILSFPVDEATSDFVNHKIENIENNIFYLTP